MMAAQPKKECDPCHKVCGRGKVSQEVLDELESAYEILQSSEHESLLKKHLTKDVFDELKDLKTPHGSTLWDCIRSGVINLDSGIGVYAPDAQAYVVFDLLFDSIIEEYHMGFKHTDKHPPTNWGNLRSFENLDPEGEFVISTRVRCGRSLDGFPFNPMLTMDQYLELESKVSNCLTELKGELKGTYYPLKGMSKEDQQKLIDDHFLFKEGDRFLEAANSNRFWPSGRGIYHNNDKTFLVWINEEDHMRIISMEEGGNLQKVYGRLVEGVKQIEKKLKFSRSPRLGYLTFCPTNLGTTVRASVHIKLPKLASDYEQLEKTAAQYNLQVRGTSGEHSDSTSGVYDISNKRRMGLTEFDAVKEMQDGIFELIKIEKSMLESNLEANQI